LDIYCRPDRGVKQKEMKHGGGIPAPAKNLYTRPCATIASATLMKPQMLAPST
jgi:hypothetical protein